MPLLLAIFALLAFGLSETAIVAAIAATTLPYVVVATRSTAVASMTVLRCRLPTRGGYGLVERRA